LLLVLVVVMASGSAFGRGSGGHGGGGHSGGHHFTGTHVGGHHFGRSRAGFGIFLAAPAFLYYPPLPYYPPDTLAPTGPPVYIEQDGAPIAPDQPAGYWYYCADSRAYYPQVKECAGTWQPVAPQVPQRP
jgi:hypothetical protein